jgi:hypothetical protein
VHVTELARVLSGRQLRSAVPSFSLKAEPRCHFIEKYLGVREIIFASIFFRIRINFDLSTPNFEIGAKPAQTFVFYHPHNCLLKSGKKTKASPRNN